MTQSEQLVERSFDPTQRAMISQETEELSDESSMAGNAAVTAASNLPEQGAQDGEKQQSQRAETRQRANYEVGGVTRQIDHAARRNPPPECYRAGQWHHHRGCGRNAPDRAPPRRIWPPSAIWSPPPSAMTKTAGMS